jgi:hypothetical protein
MTTWPVLRVRAIHRRGMTGAAVAAWLAVTLVGSYELLMMIIRGAQGQLDSATEPGAMDSDPDTRISRFGQLHDAIAAVFAGDGFDLWWFAPTG